MVYIICKGYNHFNRAMGKYISSKKQYDEEMKRGGYVTQEEGDRLYDTWKDKQLRPQLSKEARDIIRSAKEMTGKDGKVRMTGQLKKAIKNIGELKKADLKKLPSHYQGGFYE